MQSMWRWIPLLAMIAVPAATAQGTAGPGQADVPAWAFPPPQTSGVPGSTRKFSDTAIFDRTRPVDWFPDDHPAAPDAVRGRAQLFACGYCHSPDGGGRPENAALAGLSMALGAFVAGVVLAALSIGQALAGPATGRPSPRAACSAAASRRRPRPCRRAVANTSILPICNEDSGFLLM